MHNLTIRGLVAIAVAIPADNIRAFPRILARSTSRDRGRIRVHAGLPNTRLAHELRRTTVHMRLERAKVLAAATVGADLCMPCLAIASLDYNLCAWRGARGGVLRHRHRAGGPTPARLRHSGLCDPFSFNAHVWTNPGTLERRAHQAARGCAHVHKRIAVANMAQRNVRTKVPATVHPHTKERELSGHCAALSHG